VLGKLIVTEFLIRSSRKYKGAIDARQILARDQKHRRSRCRLCRKSAQDFFQFAAKNFSRGSLGYGIHKANLAGLLVGETIGDEGTDFLSEFVATIEAIAE
jgi:hypothetical protein